MVQAVHARRAGTPDDPAIAAFAAALRATLSREALVAAYATHAHGAGDYDAHMRRVLVAALARGCGSGLRVGMSVAFKHLETFTFGDDVFLGDYAYLQGRFDGACTVGDRTWIGPQSYFDARALTLGSDVGWGPGAKVLGSAHLEQPADRPLIANDLVIKPVTVEDGADIGVGAVLLPGITIGRGAIVGAGAVVSRDVEPMAVVAGVPAKFQRWREGHTPA